MIRLNVYVSGCIHDLSSLEERARGGLLLFHNGFKYRTNLTAYNKINWRCCSGKCHCRLQTNQFTNIHALKMFSQPKHNHNHKRSLKEDCFPCIEDQKFTSDEKCIKENIHVDCYDRLQFRLGSKFIQY